MRGLTPAEAAELVEMSGPPGNAEFTDVATEETLRGLLAQGRVSYRIEADGGYEWDCYSITPAGRAALALHLRLTTGGAL